jgi:nascent polypeptide-associated complex subunit alpha
MMPSGRLNERSMRLAMRKMGMTTEALEDVEQVIIRRKAEEVVLDHPEVTLVTVQGMKTFQIVGEPHSRPRGTSPDQSSAPVSPSGPPEEDIDLVMGQVGCDRTTAVTALRDSNGEPAEAILKLLAKKKG